MNRKRFLRRFVVTAASCCLVFALALLAPSIVAFIWHMSHSHEQELGDYQIAVPSSFIMQRMPTGIRLIRARAMLSPALYQFESIEISQTPGHVDVDKWKLSAMHAIAKTGDTSARGFNVNIGGNPSACIVREQNDPSVKTVALCRSSKDLRVEYFGNDASLRSIKDVLLTVQRKSSAS